MSEKSLIFAPQLRTITNKRGTPTSVKQQGLFIMFDNLKSHIAPIDKEVERIFLEVIELMKENKATMWNTAFDARISPWFIRWNGNNGEYFFSNVVGLFLDGDGSKVEHLKMVLRPIHYKTDITNEEFANIVSDVDAYYEYEICKFNPDTEETTHFAYQFARFCHMYQAGLIGMTSEDMISEIEKMVREDDGYVLLTEKNGKKGGIFLLNPEKKGRGICYRQIVLKCDYSDGNNNVCSLHLIDDDLHTWNLEDYLNESEIKMVYERVKENTARK